MECGLRRQSALTASRFQRGRPSGMHYFHWIAGTILAIAWFSRIVDAALGMPKVANISTAEWDRNPVPASGNLAPGNPLVSIIVPARNEERDIEHSLARL